MPRSKTQWKKGQSGNPKGRANGTGKIAQLRALLEPHAEELVQKARDMAMDGDSTALRLCLERLVPAIKIKDEPVSIEGLKGDASLVEQGQAVIDALSVGEVSPGEAASVMQSIASQARIIEVDDLEKRVSELEKNNGG
jgi:hypothetical protein